jgi:hypothetical protein
VETVRASRDQANRAISFKSRIKNVAGWGDLSSFSCEREAENEWVVLDSQPFCLGEINGPFCPSTSLVGRQVRMVVEVRLKCRRSETVGSASLYSFCDSVARSLYCSEFALEPGGRRTHWMPGSDKRWWPPGSNVSIDRPGK